MLVGVGKSWEYGALADMNSLRGLASFHSTRLFLTDENDLVFEYTNRFGERAIDVRRVNGLATEQVVRLNTASSISICENT